ncbi:hypothetical protein [Actinoplanes sp. NPDC049802]|uniref:hypothetical protein n=1 Tax=Actinoplanes sp. NPDC049802 TaxID=3154742 RepID=UPI00340445F7
MALLDDAMAGEFIIVVPTLAIAEAQAVLGVASSLWYHILGMPDVRQLDLSVGIALEVGRIAAPRLVHHPVHTALIGPLMIAQVLYEAKTMQAVIVTTVPEAYGGHDISVQTV